MFFRFRCEFHLIRITVQRACRIQLGTVEQVTADLIPVHTDQEHFQATHQTFRLKSDVILVNLPGSSCITRLQRKVIGFDFNASNTSVGAIVSPWIIMWPCIDYRNESIFCIWSTTYEWFWNEKENNRWKTIDFKLNNFNCKLREFSGACRLLSPPPLLSSRWRFPAK